MVEIGWVIWLWWQPVHRSGNSGNFVDVIPEVAAPSPYTLVEIIEMVELM